MNGLHTTIVLVDVEKFTDHRRTNHDQLQIRSGLYAVTRAAFEECEIPWRESDVEDRGDGIMILVSATISKNVLAAGLPDLLAGKLREHNARSEPQIGIRLRVALHAGEVHRDSHGATSESLNHAFRLLAADAPRQALAKSPAVLVLIVSESFYTSVIHHDPAARPDSYLPVDFAAKETTGKAWIRLLGESAPEETPKSAPEQAAQASATRDVQRSGHIAEDQLMRLLTAGAPNSRARRNPLTILVESLLAIPTMAHEAGRRLLLDRMRPELANAVPYFSQSRQHVFSLVGTCLNYIGGLEELLSVVHQLEGDSEPVQRLDRTVAELLSGLQD